MQLNKINLNIDNLNNDSNARNTRQQLIQYWFNVGKIWDSGQILVQDLMFAGSIPPMLPYLTKGTMVSVVLTRDVCISVCIEYHPILDHLILQRPYAAHDQTQT